MSFASRIKYLGLVTLVWAGLILSGVGAESKPLMKEFIGMNGHFKFRPELYAQVCQLARNYHNLNWDVKQPGDPITLPMCVNRVDWAKHVYGPWKKAGFETDICVQFSGFQADKTNYQALWRGKEQWCRDYGKALAEHFGPSGKEKLCTSIEIGNEPGKKFDAALYKAIFKNMAQGIRDGDPKIRILTPAVQARKGDDYIQDLREIYGDKDVLPLYDVINLHTYATMQRKNNSESSWNRSYPEDPAIDYLKVIDEIMGWRTEQAKEKEIWITEFGYDACTPEAMARRDGWFLKLDWQGVTDLQQAQYLVRSLLAFAERDVQRAYIYFFDDNDSPSVHGASGLTRHFKPKLSFWAIKQMFEVLGEYRFKRVVEKKAGELWVDEFENGRSPEKIIWVAWSPTGARTNGKSEYAAHEVKLTLSELPGMPEAVLPMATTESAAPKASWEKAGENKISLCIGESPSYIIMTAKR